MKQTEPTYSLDALIDAEVARKLGRIPKEPNLTKFSESELQAAIENAYLFESQGLDDEEKKGLLEQIRAERESSYLGSHSDQTSWIATDIDITGNIHAQSITSLLLMGIIGIAVVTLLIEREFIAALFPIITIGFIFLYNQLPTKHLHIDVTRKIHIKQGKVLIPLDLSSFSHARLYVSRPRGGIVLPTFFLAQKKPIVPIFSFLQALFFPKSTKNRMILFFSSWKDEKARSIAPWALADLLRTACKKEGLVLQKQGFGFIATNENSLS